MGVAIGANLSYKNSSFLWECFFRKLGMKPRSSARKPSTENYNMANSGQSNFPRQIGICAKYSATTAPQSNTSTDAPSGVGDICVYFAATNTGIAHIDPSNIHIYRCSAYVSNTVFTWTQIVS